MITDRPGKLAEGLYLLGRSQNLMYLARGRENMLIGGGMSWLVPWLEEQLPLLIGDEGIQYLVIQHAHFDHVGAVSYLQRKFPAMKIIATQAAVKLLCRDKVIKYMNDANMLAVERGGHADRCRPFDISISPVNVDIVADDATVIDLGNGMEVRFIDTPGHTPCSLSVYIPLLKAIFPSDSAPFPIGSLEYLNRPSPQYDYGLYKESLCKLLGYDVEVCGYEHFSAVVGPDARQALVNGLELCSEFEEHVQKLYREAGDIEKVAGIVERETSSYTRFDFDSTEIMLPVCRAVVRNILKDAGLISG